MATYHHVIFGLGIESEIKLYDLPIQKCEPDVVIQYGKVPDSLPEPKAKGVLYEASPNAFLLKMDRVARYYVSGGNRIIIEPDQMGHTEDMLLFLMGSAMGALLHQRNILPLHGSAVKVNGKGVLFSGPSGAGKSTLAAGFHKQGHPVIADDICSLSVESNGRARVVTGLPHLKLWADALNKLETDPANLNPVRHNGKIKKFYLPADRICDTPIPVQSVFVLGTTNTDRLEIKQLNGMDKAQTLIKNTFRMNFLKGLGGKEKHFETCAKVAAKTSIFKVTRPKSPFLLNELMELVADKLP